MDATGGTMTLVVPARAKLNLDLAVLGRTDDGFHEIRTHIQVIALHDLLALTAAENTTLTITGYQVPGASQNSILKAHAALEQAGGRKLPTRFNLDKRIPPGSGMGGASSDAATALRGLNAIHNVKLNLNEIAASVG